jgi:hypothetical protein
MRILFEITHPKHAHVFHYAIGALRSRGHTVAITARDKDVTVDLLRAWGLEFTVLSSRSGRGLLALGRELLVRDWRLWRFARRFRPDVLVAHEGPSAAHVGFLLRRPVIAFEDTEHSTFQHRITYPLVTRVCTSWHYERDWGAKHVRYPSIGELAYLHPNQFVPDPSVLQRAGLRAGEPFSVVRFVSWQAVHDRGQSGIVPAERRAFLERLERFGRVVVSSEQALPADLERFRLRVPPHQFHDVLAHAQLCIGEGGSVACEAALLGVPAIFVSTLRVGYLNRLEQHYQLAFSLSDSARALELAERLLSDPNTPAVWQERRARLLEVEEDLVPWMVREIEAFAPKEPKTLGA